MAKNTSVLCNNLVIYEVYVRNQTEAGTFVSFEKDLSRIKNLGVDVIWFMPIHPIGKLNKKGTLGCPYSIVNYGEVNPEYGSLDDFKRIIQAVHALGMKVMIDVVYNHTSHDSVLVRQHPEYFHQDSDGNPLTTVPEWSDVIDLKHPNPALSQYLIDCLLFWSKQGVDGFRCDVASLVPIDFWAEARKQVAEINPETIWLAETVHAAFLENRRKYGLSGFSDSEVYQAFDLTYDYDIWPIFQAAVSGIVPPDRLLEMIRFQRAIYPSNFIKMHCVENHDQRRIMALAPSPSQALAWTAFELFLPGAFLIYGGQESAAIHTPSLFDKDPVTWGDYPLQTYFNTLFRIKKHNLMQTGVYSIRSAQPFIQAEYSGPASSLVGIFNTGARIQPVEVDIPDGTYPDLISGKPVTVDHSKMNAPDSACILEIPFSLPDCTFHSVLLDTNIKPV